MCPGETKTRNKRQRQETEDQGEEKRNKQRRGRDICPQRNKGLLLDREADMAHRQMAVYKSKRGQRYVRVTWVVLIGHDNWGSQEGLLILCSGSLWCSLAPG